MFRSQSLQMTNLFSLCCGRKPQEVQTWRDPWYAFQHSYILPFIEYEHIGENVYNVTNALLCVLFAYQELLQFITLVIFMN